MKKVLKEIFVITLYGGLYIALLVLAIYPCWYAAAHHTLDVVWFFGSFLALLWIIMVGSIVIVALKPLRNRIYDWTQS